MPDFLTSAFAPISDVAPLDVLLRLLAALLLGGVVAWIYGRARGSGAAAGSFPGTLLLLTVLIAMSTQVIGNNAARAFSLVGVLSIVRFRTVVRDAQDTAYVIFAVVIGMAVGAHNLWVAALGLAVVGLAVWMIGRVPGAGDDALDAHVLNLRVGLGHELDALLGGAFERHLAERRLMAVETNRQGLSLDVTYEARLRPDTTADQFVKTLNRLEGVQSISVKRRGFEPV